MRDACAGTIPNVKGRVGGGNGGAVQLDRCFMTSGSDRFDEGMQSGGRDSPHFTGAASRLLQAPVIGPGQRSGSLLGAGVADPLPGG
jgi:hypothetical protein